MYFAQFESVQGAFLSTAFALEGAATAAAAPGWGQRLAEHPRVDVSLRVSRAGASRVVVLAADLNARSELAQCREALLGGFASSDLTLADDAAAFDRLVGALPPLHLRVSHDGYHHQGLPLACEFRLYAALAPGAAVGCWQCGLRRHVPSAQMERRVLKYLAWLELDQPFSEAVRAVQATLVQRLRQPGWLADEYLAFEDAAALAAVRSDIERQFAATGGRIGFSEAPLEAGSYDDWMATGCLRMREDLSPRELPALGAALFSPDEIDWLFDRAFGAAASPSVPRSARSATPQVFISYASSDFARATQLCESLEARGVACWIAPRDIQHALLPYTEAITLALSQVRAVVVLLSQMANHSVHIPRELDLALERRLPIVPLRLEKVVPAGQLDYLLRTCQWLEAFERDRAAVIAELLSRLDTQRA